MKIFVAGASGQLGSELRELAPEFPGWQFLFTDIDTLDITNEKELESYFEVHTPDFIINCAAYTAVDKAESDIETAWKINALAPKLIAGFAKANKAKFIHVSTDYVFDGADEQPKNETDPVNPINVYGQTKLDGENYALSVNPETIVIRTAWLYSSYGHNFVKTMLRLGSERDEISVVNDQTGTPTYAADLANAILQIIKKSESDPKRFLPGIYHYSNEGIATWYDFASAIFEVCKVPCKINPINTQQYPTPAKRPVFSVLNKSKIRETFEIKIPEWKESLEVCCRKLGYS